jgi:uncharacterized caspase-like protein
MTVSPIARWLCLVLLAGMAPAKADCTEKGPLSFKQLRLDCLQGVDLEAQGSCRSALEQAPDNLRLRLRLGDLLQYEEKYADSVAVFQDAVRRHPDSKKARNQLEVAESLLAEYNWQKKSRKPKGPSKAVNGKRSRILCLRLKGQRGLDACNEALTALPDDAELHHGKAKILLGMGRPEEAVLSVKAALNRDPANATYRRTLAQASPPKPQPAPAVTATAAVKTPEAPKAPQKPKVAAAPPPATPAPPLLDPANPPPKAAAKTSTGKADPPSQGASAGVVQRLALLKSLQDRGLIEADEYERRKTALLDKALQPPAPPPPPAIPDIPFGNYHALVIGNQKYRTLTPLQTAQRDALTVAWALEKHYGFKVTKLMDASRSDILLALREYRKTIGKTDNLLVYYAGHGWLDEEADAGYWLPVDAARDNDVDWVSLSAITSAVRAIPAKHVLVVADSCFAGKLTRDIHLKRRTPGYLKKISQKRARVVLTSGGLEPVADTGGARGHSVFAAAFLKVLKENDGVMDGETLFSRLRRPVMLAASQTPEYSDIRKAGHEGGDFLFVRKQDTTVNN